MELNFLKREKKPLTIYEARNRELRKILGNDCVISGSNLPPSGGVDMAPKEWADYKLRLNEAALQVRSDLIMRVGAKAGMPALKGIMFTNEPTAETSDRPQDS